MSVPDVLNLPFHVGRPCLTALELAGRTDLVADIVGFLSADDMQSVSLIGEPGIGKTSLLSCLPMMAKDWVPEGCRLPHFVYLNPRELQIESPEAFFAQLYVRLKPIGYVGSLREPYSDLDRALEHLNERHERLALLLDDFHFLTLQPSFPVAFFEHLRSILANKPHVGAVVASHMNLKDLCSTVELAGSAFFNIFNTRTLGPLELNDARQLLRSRLSVALATPESPIEQMLVEIGPHPHPLHLAGSLWLRQWEETNRVDPRTVWEDAYRQAKPHYDRVWKTLNEKQLEMLRRALLGAPTSAESVDHDFVDRGWIRVTGNRLELGSRHFERYAQERLGMKRRSSLWERFFGRS